jgi:hypothetical protein
MQPLPIFQTHLIGIGTSIGHTQPTTPIVQIVGMKFIGKGDFVTPN